MQYSVKKSLLFQLLTKIFLISTILVLRRDIFWSVFPGILPFVVYILSTRKQDYDIGNPREMVSVHFNVKLPPCFLYWMPLLKFSVRWKRGQLQCQLHCILPLLNRVSYIFTYHVYLHSVFQIFGTAFSKLMGTWIITYCAIHSKNLEVWFQRALFTCLKLQLLQMVWTRTSKSMSDYKKNRIKSHKE